MCILHLNSICLLPVYLVMLKGLKHIFAIIYSLIYLHIFIPRLYIDALGRKRGETWSRDPSDNGGESVRILW